MIIQLLLLVQTDILACLTFQALAFDVWENVFDISLDRIIG